MLSALQPLGAAIESGPSAPVSNGRRRPSDKNDDPAIADHLERLHLGELPSDGAKDEANAFEDDIGPSAAAGAYPEAFAVDHSTSARVSSSAAPRSPSRKGKERAWPLPDHMDAGNASSDTRIKAHTDELVYRTYRSEAEDLAHVMRLVEAELSEPYNIYTFRYFLIEWPHLAFLVYPTETSTIPIGTIICKQDSHRNRTNRGYIAMLSVDRAWRRRGIASRLVRLAIDEMTRRGAHEIVLETESDNATSLALYESLGFIREKRLQRFYSNGKDAFRLILPMPNHPYLQDESDDEAEYGRWEIGAGPEWLEGLDEEEAEWRGLGGPEVGTKNGHSGQAGPEAGWRGQGGDCGGRPPTPRPGKPDLPPRPTRDWDGMYT